MTTESSDHLRVDWVEIIEPRTREHMFANLTTGECVWDAPAGVQVKKTDDNQWWELYDQNTSRFYYYNAADQKTVWHRPQNCDIIPLAKLQTLKQNTEVQDEEDKVKKESVGTQTSIKIVGANDSSNANKPRTVTTSTQTSPISSPRERRKHHHHHHHNQKHGCTSPQYPSSVSAPFNGELRTSQGCWQSERSSDSSISHSRSSLDHRPIRRHDSCCSTESGESSHLLCKNEVAYDFRNAINLGPPSYRQRSFDMDHNLPHWRQSSMDSPALGISRSSSMRMGPRPNEPIVGLQSVESTPRLQRRDEHEGRRTPVLGRRNWARSSSRSTDSNPSSPQSPGFQALRRQESVGTVPEVPPKPVRSTPECEKYPTPLYSNLDLWESQSYLLPLQHYLMEQAKLSGCHIGDFLGDDRDSLSQSDDDSEGRRDEEDDFADDEAMSHQDSSSQEYLDESRFLDEDEDEEENTYCEPMETPPQQRRQKASQKAEIDRPSTQHASLRRKRPEGAVNSPAILEKSQSFQPDMGHPAGHRPLSLLSTDGGAQQRQANMGKKPPSESDIEKYAQDNLNRHTKGIFRKKFTIQELLSWSKDSIRKPMITTTDKALKREACDLFKLIQMYMGDRKIKGAQTPNAVALDIATRGWSKASLRDELFIQTCRQTTDNPRWESLKLGWELLTICLAFFPPSVKFQPYLESYISRYVDKTFDTPELKVSQYAAVAAKRLERIGKSGAKKGLRKPVPEEIEQSRIQIFRPSMFGNTLEEVMALQERLYPSRQLPWIQITLSEAVLTLGGAQTEGIFRVPGDIDEVNAMKLRMDRWEPVEASDPHVPASLLKLWYRELYEPLIPATFYQECIDSCSEPEVAIVIVQRLPEINRLVLSYLIRFLQVFAAEENSTVTKMDSNNLAMVMAPNCLRCMSDDPRIIFENTRKEMGFVRCLIQHLDTSYMEGVM